MVLTTFFYRGKGYPYLWPSTDCQQPLDVSKESTFEVIDGILSGDFSSCFNIISDLWKHEPNYIALIADQNFKHVNKCYE